MKKRVKILRYLSIPVLFVGIALGLSSCSVEEGPISTEEEGLDDKPVEVTFTLNTGNNTTRHVDSGEMEEPGSYLENYIDPTKVCIGVFSGTYDSFAQVQPFIEELSISSVDSIADGEYKVVGSISHFTSGFKICVCANTDMSYTECINYAKSTTGYNSNYDFYYGLVYQHGCFSYDYAGKAFELSKENPIPMWGIKTYSSSNDYAADNSGKVDLGEIKMLRAMAKIIVQDDNNQIYKISLANCYNGGSAPPWAMYQNTTTPTALNINPPAAQTAGNKFNLSVITNIQFNQVRNKYIAYVPEYYQVKSSGFSTRLNPATATYIDIVDEWGRSYKIEFKNYVSGTSPSDAVNSSAQLFNIVRNHIYEYEVMIPGDNGLAYRVLDWSDYTSGDIIFN